MKTLELSAISWKWLVFRTQSLGALLGFVLAVPALAEDVRILSLSQNGVLTWTNSTLNVTCRVEWAATVDGPWHSSWESLTNIVVTNLVTERSVPMFYRVVCTLPPVPMVTNISAQAALTLIINHVGDTNFVILDVRRATEFATRHIKGAVNQDVLLSNFESAMSAMDRTKTYLVHCAAGSRSPGAVATMQRLGFLTIYHMPAGFSGFAALAGAAPYLEP